MNREKSSESDETTGSVVGIQREYEGRFTGSRHGEDGGMVAVLMPLNSL